MGRARGFGWLSRDPLPLPPPHLRQLPLTPRGRGRGVGADLGSPGQPRDHQGLNEGDSFAYRGATLRVFAQLPSSRDAACVPGASPACVGSVGWTQIIANSPAKGAPQQFCQITGSLVSGLSHTLAAAVALLGGAGNQGLA